ncbi:hypothetical protein EDB19DRAFT_1657423 [Suillus lakei]|nr:hypothetical protein EDB19DRAFT_1657423 [Suillus lakei]
MSSFPDYYALLNVSKTATAEEIRQAYKRESLRCFDTERRTATEKFQAVADAYYVLSDPVRRKEYDALYSSKGAGDKSSDPKASSSFFTHFASMFGGAGATPAQEPRPDAENVFADVFEEGAYAGNRVGAIRDAKGKSVAAVFSELGGSQKAEILRALAAKVLGATM